MNWQIYTLGGGQYLQLIFNGVVAIMGNGDYMYLLKIGILLGMLTVMLRSAYKGALIDLQWLLFAAMGFYIAFLPTATVIITDELDPSQSAVVNNVPLGLAATAGFSNAVGPRKRYFPCPATWTTPRTGCCSGTSWWTPPCASRSRIRG